AEVSPVAGGRTTHTRSGRAPPSPDPASTGGPPNGELPDWSGRAGLARRRLRGARGLVLADGELAVTGLVPVLAAHVALPLDSLDDASEALEDSSSPTVSLP